MFAVRLPCVSMTPLLRPVVPDEYGSTTTSSLVTGTCSVSGGLVIRSIIDGTPSTGSMVMTSVTSVPSIASIATSRNMETVTNIVAPESCS